MITVKALAPLEEFGMLATLIPVIYRDSNGIRTHGGLRLDGSLTLAHAQALKAALYDGREFVPGQLGLSHSGATESSTFPGPNDHGWHILLVDDAIILDEADRCWTGAGATELTGVFIEQFGRHIDLHYRRPVAVSLPVDVG